MTVLYDPDQRNHQSFLRVINTTAVSLKMLVSAVGVRDRGEIEQAIAALVQREESRGRGPARSRQQYESPYDHPTKIARYRLPAIYPLKYYVKEGGLVCYAVDQVDQWGKAAEYVDRILRGEKPGDLPVQAPTKYELALNLKAAKELGLTISPTLLARADELVE